MNHVSACLGPLVLIHGGINTETKKVLGDFNLFDVDVGEWIRCEISNCESEQYNQEFMKVQARHMHTM